MMTEHGFDAAGVAAFTLVTALLERMVAHNGMTKGEAVELCLKLSKTKVSMGFLSDSEVESEAAMLLADLASQLDKRL